MFERKAVIYEHPVKPGHRNSICSEQAGVFTLCVLRSRRVLKNCYHGPKPINKQIGHQKICFPPPLQSLSYNAIFEALQMVHDTVLIITAKNLGVELLEDLFSLFKTKQKTQVCRTCNLRLKQSCSSGCWGCCGQMDSEAVSNFHKKECCD